MFLRNCKDEGELLRYFRAFKKKLSRAQRVVKSFVSVTHHRLMLLEKQWDRIDQARMRKALTTQRRFIEVEKKRLQDAFDRDGRAPHPARLSPRAKRLVERSRIEWAKYHLPQDLREIPVIPPEVRLQHLRMLLRDARRRFVSERRQHELAVAELRGVSSCQQMVRDVFVSAGWFQNSASTLWATPWLKITTQGDES